MDRRTFVILLAGAAGLGGPAAADRKKARIGWLDWFPPSVRSYLDHFRDEMQKLGYAEGKNYELEAYFVSGNRELAEDAARKLVQEPVDVLIASATPAIHVAKETTDKIPIVMITANALAAGLVPSLAHPGGNLTGVSLLMTDVAGKRLELLRNIRPTIRTVAFLGSTGDTKAAASDVTLFETFAGEARTAAGRLGVRLSVYPVAGPPVINQAIFDAMKLDGCEAVIVQPIFTGFQDKIVPLAMNAKLPVVADFSVFAEAGAILTYGANQPALIRRTAHYVDRILKGTKHADLPIEQPTALELVVNKRTAAQLDWTIPQDVLVLADRVIE
jgi:putative tryptophan/tyrosine transport system substrate-binding protein